MKTEKIYKVKATYVYESIDGEKNTYRRNSGKLQTPEDVKEWILENKSIPIVFGMNDEHVAKINSVRVLIYKITTEESDAQFVCESYENGKCNLTNQQCSANMFTCKISTLSSKL